jgi:hypothetical protein
MPTDFLWAAGSGNNGLIGSLVSLMTTELESLTNGSVIVSSVNGSSGVFTNSNTSQSILGEIYYFAGNAGCTPTTAGGGLAGWFLTTPDSTAYEIATSAPARGPDFLIPLPLIAIGGAVTTVQKSWGLVRIPALPFKVLIQNNSGVTLGAGGTTAPYLKFAPTAVQY